MTDSITNNSYNDATRISRQEVITLQTKHCSSSPIFLVNYFSLWINTEFYDTDYVLYIIIIEKKIWGHGSFEEDIFGHLNETTERRKFFCFMLCYIYDTHLEQKFHYWIK